MASGRRDCINKADVLCYICGEFTPVVNRNLVTNFLKRVYHSYFDIKLGDQVKVGAPHTVHVCMTCMEISASVDQRSNEIPVIVFHDLPSSSVDN